MESDRRLWSWPLFCWLMQDEKRNWKVLRPERKIIRKCENEKASEPLCLWFPKQREERAPESWSLPQKKKKETIFHEFNTNKPDFIASTGWKDFWKNFTVCGSSPSVKKKYRQIQNHFWNLQKKFSVLCKMKVHLIQTSNTDRPAWTAKCCYPTIASHEEKSARRYIWSRQLSDCCIVSQVSMLQTDFMGISPPPKKIVPSKI